MTGDVTITLMEWEETTGRLPRPWTIGSITADLRAWAAREESGQGARPGRAVLAARWGVPTSQARRAIVGFDADMASAVVVETAISADISPNLTSMYNNTRNPPSSEKESSQKPSSKHGKLGSIWADINSKRALYLKRSGQKRVRDLKLTQSRASVLKARLRDSDHETITSLWEWVFTSEHTRAVYLRSNGYATPETLHSAKNHQGYVEMMEAEARKTRRSSPQGQVEGFLKALEGGSQ